MRGLRITSAGALRALADRLDPRRTPVMPLLGWFWNGSQYVYSCPPAVLTNGTSSTTVRWIIGGSS